VASQKIQLVSLDLDGTVLDSQSQLPPEVAKTIREVKSRGIYVTLATGRTFGSARPFAAQLGIDIPIIAYNGAYVSHICAAQPIVRTPLLMADARKMIGQLEQMGCYVKVYIEDHLYVQEHTDETVAFSKKFGVPFTVVGACNLSKLTDNPLKIVVIEKNDRIRAVWQLLNRWQTTFNMCRDSASGIEIMERNTNKGLAVSKVCQLLNIPMSAVMAVGNEGNDLQMVCNAGLGIAMGNAYDELKKCAKAVAKTNDQLGVAQVLREYILEKQ